MVKNLKINLNIIYGKNSLQNLTSIIKDLGFKNIILICDNKIRNFEYLKNNIKFIKKKFFFTFNEEPTYQQLNKEVRVIKKFRNIDCIIAIGGGSTLDFAKGIAILLKNKGNSLKFMGFPKGIKKIVPLIAIPTTVSTGSEIIYNAVFTDKLKGIKLGINYNKNYPIASILDPKLISDAPRKIIIQSTLASLMRSIETFTSPDSDEITRFFSKQAFKMILEGINIDKNKINYKKLQWGCVFSMIALSNSSSGPCGVINYYLSVNYNISQPLAYSFSALEFFKHNIKHKYFGYSGIIEGNELKNISNSKKFLKKIVDVQNLLSSEIQIGKKKIKYKEKELDNIYNLFKNKKFIPLKKNPIKISKKQLKEIIKKIIK